MGNFERAVYRELNYPESIGVYGLGKAIRDEDNQWFRDVLSAFEEEGAETEGYWLGVDNTGDVEYDIVADVFDYGFEDPIPQDVKLLFASKPSVYRHASGNEEVMEYNPLENYKKLARKVDGNLDALFVPSINEDAGGDIPSHQALINQTNQLNGLRAGSNLVTMHSASTGEEALLVKSTRFPYNVPEPDS